MEQAYGYQPLVGLAPGDTLPQDFTQGEILAPGSTGFTGAGSGAPLDREGFRKKVLERFDADGDGQISESERATAHEVLAPIRERMSAIRQQMLENHDADGDGKLSAEEREKAHADRTSRIEDPELKALFQAFRVAHESFRTATRGRSPAEIQAANFAFSTARDALTAKKQSLKNGGRFGGL